ncbi:L,D-transpeptidase family protein [Marinobacterium lutimaris]|uniref:Murein L,D-transpeptidase YcbB/YkuD n=1 Tax=Marinobacterium lutimaris TaxID=568106 RepID=A0A1H6D5F3_9GAMM|nr:L,D-transpeptidase family protein [Marinobacterium lutimaris]SEG80609.1 Murein L,D-transpeptidase YcbB/YkuD [Marinobacterium lutimaris]
MPVDRSPLRCLLLTTLLSVLTALSALNAVAAPVPAAQGQVIQTVGEIAPDWSRLYALYARSQSPYLWHDAEQHPDIELIDSLLNAVDIAYAQGLPASRYHDVRLSREPDPGVRDLLLSDALIRLMNDLGRGRDEAAIDRLWYLPRPDIDPVEQAWLALQQRAPSERAEVLAPRSPQYLALVDLYGRYRALLKKGSVQPLQLDDLLEPGDQSVLVPALRERLVQLGDAQPDPLAMETAPDLYDQPLAESLKRFQARHGLAEDSVVGPKTLAELNRSLDQRLAQIEVNLERWRWMPRELGQRYILVSPAGYFLELVENDQVSLYAKTITGRPRRPTPSFQSDLSYLTVNPDWTVPRRIMREDLLPKVRADINWLAENQVRVQQYRDGSWSYVAAEEIDWQAPGNIRMIQAPGAGNALGQLKLGMENPYSIYLHDTPSKYLFDKPLRPFSSGCVRVEGIEQLAQRLIADSPSMQSWFDAAQAGGEKRIRKLPQSVPVYLVYLSAWVDPEGGAQFRPDIYGLDAQLQARLDAAAPISDTQVAVHK